MQTKIFLLAHQDDEIAIFNHIKNSVQSNNKTLIIYATNGRIKKKENSEIIKKRELESSYVLRKIGVKKKNIIFLGKKLNINSYELHLKLDLVYKKLNLLINKIQGKIIIYTHSWEGGNMDHDSCYIIILKLMNKFPRVIKAFQFAMYNSNKMLLKFYKAFSPIKNNGPLVKLDINFKEKIRFICLLFSYKSQLKIWIGLYPVLILNILSNNYGYLQQIKKKKLLNKPHGNELWYEKRKFGSYNENKLLFLKFLK